MPFKARIMMLISIRRKKISYTNITDFSFYLGKIYQIINLIVKSFVTKLDNSEMNIEKNILDDQGKLIIQSVFDNQYNFIKNDIKDLAETPTG